MNTKIAEINLSAYLSKLIYSVLEDIQRASDNVPEYSTLVYQSYDNLCKNKKDRLEGLKSIFTISDPARQFLSFLFFKVIGELKNVTIGEKDTMAFILENITITEAICYGPFIFKMSSGYATNFGAALRNAGDNTRWISGQLLNHFPQYTNKPLVLALISTEFDQFLKTLAYLLGNMLWYNSVNISEGLLLGLFAQFNMPHELIDLMRQNLRQKRSRAKKTVRPETTDNTELVLDDESSATLKQAVGADPSCDVEDSLSELLAKV